MNKLKSNIILSFITFNLLNFSCFPWGIRNDVESYAQLFIDVHDLGRRITLHSSFNEFLGHIPDRKWDSRVYLSRIDDLPIGRGYGDLDKWDMALETGFIDGLIRKGLIIAEKLDHVSPRNKSEFIDTSPEDAFYMHGIDLNDLGIIKNDMQASSLLTYQVMDFSESDLSLTIYLRMIDLESMKVMTSAMINIGEFDDAKVAEEISGFNEAYEIIKNVGDFPSSIFTKSGSLALLNADILNISGKYKKAPSKETMAIENGIITGLINNEKYNDNNPIIKEKTRGFKLKYPSVYNSIVFNTNPIIYEEWSELFKETDCNLLMMYRFMPENGLYVKIINVRDNGRIIYSNAFAFNGRADEGVISNHDVVMNAFKANIDISLLKNKRVLIVNGDKQAVESEAYFEDQPYFNEMNLSIEEGMITSLVKQKVSIHEKLKTLYLKRPWMYDNKLFNLNPLYLDKWNQLEGFGVDILVVYNNLIPYQELLVSDYDYKKVAVGIRIIDVKSGDIIQVGELTNTN
ncbi:MAG: hypothetical protein CMF94_01760 [Candidatus Marinimicrobia bacterium]|nr:hypothetical protein [Candidatus Neomarinimicrobiota bacterium]